MKPSNLCLLYTRWRTARHPCLVVALFCGLLTVCVVSVVVWEISTWRAPSIQTRKRVEADMPTCSLDVSQLPSGWYRLWADSYLPYDKVLPDRALGGITIGFSHQNTDSTMPASHSILFYRTTFQAAFAYKFYRITRAR